MSAYSSLLNPLMNLSGLITTSALNTDAQTALASGVEANTKADTLLATALQTSGQNYTGLPAAGITLRNAASQSIITLDASSGNLTSTSILTGDISCNTLYYSSLSPPIAPSSQNLNQVLSIGNDASGQPISNVGTLSASAIQSTNSSGTASSKFNNVRIYSNDSSTETAVINAAGNANCQNFYLYGVNPNDFSITSNKNILTKGSITSNNLITGDISCNTLYYQSLSPTIVSTWVGTATSNLNMSNYDISSCNLINGVSPQFKPTYDYYVSKGGNDNNLGSILSPFLTVQKAIDICETAYDGTPRVIHLSSGSYSGNITISKPRISIIGEGASMNPDTGSSISGNFFIYLTDGNSDLNNNNIYFSGLLINGQVLDQTFGVVHRVIITNCHLYAQNDCLTVNTAYTLDYRVIINNCTISNSSSSATDPLMLFKGAGMISIINCKITSKGNAQKTVNIWDNVRSDTIAQNIFTSDSQGNDVARSIFHHQASTTITLGNNAFVYSSAGTKRNIDGAAAINITENGSLVSLNNIMSLSGLPTGQMAIYNTGSGVVVFGNNISTSSPLGTSATGISGTLNVNKFAATSVQ
jgi:hypothetical protein